MIRGRAIDYVACSPAHQKSDICALCHDEFKRTTMHAYKRGTKYFCSYTCMRAYDAKPHAVKRKKRSYKKVL